MVFLLPVLTWSSGHPWRVRPLGARVTAGRGTRRSPFSLSRFVFWMLHLAWFRNCEHKKNTIKPKLNIKKNIKKILTFVNKSNKQLSNKSVIDLQVQNWVQRTLASSDCLWGFRSGCAETCGPASGPLLVFQGQRCVPVCSPACTAALWWSTTPLGASLQNLKQLEANIIRWDLQYAVIDPRCLPTRGQKGSYQTWRCWACCPERHLVKVLFGSSPTWWCGARLALASASSWSQVGLWSLQSWSRSLCRGSNSTPAATSTTSLQTWAQKTKGLRLKVLKVLCKIMRKEMSYRNKD